MAAEENRPASPQQAPDPSDNYERSHPEHEAGMGRLDNNKAVGVRAKLVYTSQDWVLRLGGYGYAGRYTNRDEAANV